MAAINVYVVYRIVDNTGKNPWGYRLRDDNNLLMDVNYKDVVKAINNGQINMFDGESKGVIRMEELPPLAQQQEEIKKSKPNKAVKLREMNMKPQEIKGSTRKSNGMVPSLYGVQIKNLKKGLGREGEYYYGTVYYNGVKLGSWMQDPNGAICDDFEFNQNLLDIPLKKYAATNPGYASLECLMGEVLNIIDSYKAYKNMVKKGRHTMIEVTDQYGMYVTRMSCNYQNMQQVELEAGVDIDKYLSQYGENSKFKVYFSENDFCIV